MGLATCMYKTTWNMLQNYYLTEGNYEQKVNVQGISILYKQNFYFQYTQIKFTCKKVIVPDMSSRKEAYYISI